MSLIRVEPRLRPYEPYFFELLGATTRGYTGSQDGITPEQRLAKAWQDMIRRCYDSHHSEFKNYGAKGVSVCKRWHQISNYIADVQKLHGWQSKLLGWGLFDLDKDYYSSNQYGPETCVWLSRGDNTALDSKPVYVTDNLGVKVLYLSQVAAAAALGTVAQNVSQHVTAGVPVPRGKMLGYLFEHAHDAKHMRYPLTGEK